MNSAVEAVAPRSHDVREDLLEAARAIGPTLEKYSDYGERECRLHEDAVQALNAAGMLSLWVPKAYGGYEVDMVTYTAIAEEISTYDTAAGWLVMAANVFAALCANLPADTLDEIYAHSGAIGCSPSATPFTGEIVEGGLRVSGRTSFGSGCRHATYAASNVLIGPDEAPTLIQIVYPLSKATIVDNWDVLGMRGTGSDDVVVEDLFVPDGWWYPVADRPAPVTAYEGAFYRGGIASLAPVLPAVAAGALKVALGDFAQIARTKIPFGNVTALRERPVSQLNYAEALAYYRAIKAYMNDAYATYYRICESGKVPDDADRAAAWTATIFAVQSAKKAMQLIADAAGTTSIYKKNRIERCFRDIETIHHHGFANHSRYANVARPDFDLPIELALYEL